MTAAHRFRAGAALAFLAIAIATWLYWPLPELGIITDPATGIVLEVVAGSTAAQGGLKVGDRITHIYNYPWEALNTRLLLVPLPWHNEAPSPMQVQRGKAIFDLTLYAAQPGLGLQVDKALRTLVALVCWLTGVFIGISPQAANPRLRWAAWFWVLLGGALGVFQLVQVVSYVISVAILWVLGFILAPSAAMLHLWYPSRPLSSGTLRRAQRWWFRVIGLLQVVFLGLMILGQTTTGLLDLLNTSTRLIFLGSFMVSACILSYAYRATTIAHIRRQIRLIALACVIVACAWAMLILGQELAPQLLISIPPVALTVIAAVVPLAYLYGGVAADLFRVDQLARHLAAHALTIVAILSLLALTTHVGLLNPTPMLLAIVILAAYRPAFQLVRRLGTLSDSRKRPYEELNQAVAQLGTTLDAVQLAEMVTGGIRASFGDPPVAIYIRREYDTDMLELAIARRMDVPPTTTRALLRQVFRDQESLLSIGDVQQRTGHQALSSVDEALVFAPLVSLWGFIRQPQGGPLGLVILGPRGDLDPYRERDLRELERLLSAAGLAFTNSASYERQVQAQQVIRRLYRHLQQAQDATAGVIAREIHDEVLNVNVRLNIATLEKLLFIVESSHPQLYGELEALLESEQTTGTMLRLICEQLRPAYTDDPLGLMSSLRRTVERLGATWEGRVRFESEGAPAPVDRQMHRELVMIAREGVTNAMKHAAATEIIVTLHFPTEVNEPLTLWIRDNGTRHEPVTPKPKHLGLNFMRESAESIGATITWWPRDPSGVEVHVVAPLAGRIDESLLGGPGLWWDDEQMHEDSEVPVAVVGSDHPGKRDATEETYP